MKEDINLREGESRVLFGPKDRHLRITRECFGVSVVARDDLLRVEGETENVRPAMRAFAEMIGRIRSNGSLDEQEVFEIIQEERARLVGSPLGAIDEEVARSEQRILGKPPLAGGEATAPAPSPAGGRSGFPSIDPHFRVSARTEGQARYIDSIQNHDLVFAVGPAGSGKTYLAVAMAISALRKGLYRRMVLARPAVEAGEKLGFLPGDLQSKVSPYLRPLYDALNDLLDVGQLKMYMERDIIEVIPLAFMRGRTLDRSFIILDEAQNTTRAQMKMVLTRLGRNSTIIVTGDDTQIDLPPDTPSGLLHAYNLLDGVEGIGTIRLTKVDIVRHRLVQNVVEAYEKEAEAAGGGNGR